MPERRPPAPRRYDDDHVIGASSPFWNLGHTNHYTEIPKMMFHSFLVVFTVTFLATRAALSFLSRGPS